MSLTVARTAPGTAAVEVHLGGAVTRVVVPSTGRRCVWTDVTVPLAAPVKGVHDLTVVLRGALRLADVALAP